MMSWKTNLVTKVGIWKRFLLCRLMLLSLVCLQTCLGHEETVEYCSSDKLVLDCREPETVIIVQKALYGRMSAGKCITSTYAESMGCRADVTSQLESRCSGRRNCTMLVATFDSIIQPCPRDFKSYLEITYECVRASFLGDCHTHELDTKTPSPRRGYLALYDYSVANGALKTRHRSNNCVWTLRAEPGQHFIVSWRLPSVTDEQHRPTPRRNSPCTGRCFAFTSGSSPCTVTFVFVDGEVDVGGSGGDEQRHLADWADAAESRSRSRSESSGLLHATTCAMGSRDEPSRVIYTSKTNRLQLRPTDAMLARLVHGPNAVSEDANWRPHLIEYYVAGCADISPPEGAVVWRHGNEAAVVCRVDGQHHRWNVTCRDDQWVGPRGQWVKGQEPHRPAVIARYHGHNSGRTTGSEAAAATGKLHSAQC